MANAGNMTVGAHGSRADNQGFGAAVFQEPDGASRPAMMPKASAAETATPASVQGDVIVEGGPNHASYLNDLLAGFAHGKDPTAALIMLKQRVANDEAMQEALSNTLLAYHRMAMAVIGNMKA